MRTTLLLLAAIAPQDDDYQPVIHDPTGEGQAHIAAMQVPDGFTVELWAEEPMLANPVCLYVDRHGDCYLGETFRHTHGVLDMRQHRDWLEIDIGATTVEERVEMMKLAGPEQFERWGREHDQVRLIRDTDQDGKADEAIVFAGKFDGPAAGIGAGLLEHEGDVYWTCIPELWRLKDTDGDGVADEREALHTGYGVHVALLGHDLHGLRIGPDGRLYFSCGDRGFNVQTENGRVINTKSGSVLRCELDGSNLELVHNGLRNPQELVFDKWGNLFTGDNNSDSIDRARWVQILEGGENGWRYSFQWMNGGNGRGQRGSWNEEKLWFPHFPGQAAYLTPPIAWLASGPSGLAVDPGVGLPEQYADHFFLVDFRGSRQHSGVHAFDVKPKGAGFELGEVEPFVWNCLPVDGDFGPDGAYWFCDWVGGWNKTGRGRIYRMFHEEAVNTEAAKDAQAILAGGMADRSTPQLGQLLGHVHKDVRLMAQLELAGREDGGAVLRAAAVGGETTLEKVHGIWGLGVRGRRSGTVDGVLHTLTTHADPEVRAQALCVLGDLDEPGDPRELVRHFRDTPRVQYHACRYAAGVVRAAGADDPGSQALYDLVLARIEEVGESDPVLRHGLIEFLVLSGRSPGALGGHPSAAVRLAAAVAMRRLAERTGQADVPPLTSLLEDADPRVALEAARALYEFGGADGLQALGAHVPTWSDSGLTGAVVEGPGRGFLTPLMRRVISANERLGDSIAAGRVARVVASSQYEDSLRIDALRMLRTWGDAPNLDYVDGHFRDLPPRDASFVADHVVGLLGSDAQGWSPALTKAWIEATSAVDAARASEKFEGLVRDEAQPGDVRAVALDSLVRSSHDDKLSLVQFSLASEDARLRAEGLRLLGQLAPEDLQSVVPALLREGGLPEQRVALDLLGEASLPWATAILDQLLDEHLGARFPQELALELVRACESSPNIALRSKVLGFTLERSKLWPTSEDPPTEGGPTSVAKYLESLYGGDAARGKQVFERAELDCLRCHGAADATGPRIGPDLTGLGQRATRLHVLESICDPNAKLHPDFLSEAFFLKDDTILVGLVTKTDGEWLTITNADGESTDVHQDDVRTRKPDLSAMPTDLAPKISREDMRDLIEYLARR